MDDRPVTGGGTTEKSRVETDEKRDITVGLIVSWLAGVTFTLIAVSYVLTFDVLPFVFSLIAAFITLPTTRRQIEDSLNVNVSRWIIVIADVALLILAGATM